MYVFFFYISRLLNSLLFNELLQVIGKTTNNECAKVFNKHARMGYGLINVTITQLISLTRQKVPVGTKPH